ncbi:MAG: glycosyltransferase, partial [bacterium]
METNKQKVLARVATNAITLDILLKGQLRYLSQYYKVLAIASGEEILDLIRKREGVSTIHVKMNREIRLVKDIGSLISLIIIFFKNRPYIVHVNTPKASLLAMIAAKICKVPHRLYTVTGLRFETTTGLQRTLLMFMEKITCFCATKVIPEGGGVKFTLQKHRIT